MLSKFLLLVAFLYSTLICFGQTSPNILVIITDQHSGAILNQKGYDNVQTPGIDKIAEQGVTFTRSYCTYPVCTASRKSLMTGMMPSLATPTNYTSIATKLADAGYETAYFGKWHVGSTDIGEVSDWHGFQTFNDGNDDTEISEWSRDFLKQDHSKPFFLITSFLNPHDCCELARNISGESDSYHDGAVEEQMDTAYCPPIPFNFAIPENEAEGISARRNQDPGDKYWDTNPYKLWTESQWRQYMYGYDRLLEKVDAHVESVYDEMKDQGLLDNTIIIYTSDHGDGHASHQWTQKKSFYEEVVNIPFIVSWKGKTKAGVIDNKTLVSNGLDLYPTILKMAGIEIPDYLQGEDLSASFLEDAGDESPLEREYVVSEIKQSVYKSNTPGDFDGRMLVTQRFKYFLFDNGANKEQLFDLENDPGELSPVTYDPAYHDDLIACRNMLKEWVANNNDDFDVDAALFSIKYNAKRLNNSVPIITQEMFTEAGAEEEGEDINGPSVIRIPDWIAPENRADPEAVYYCYFAHHKGGYIRMAWAAEIEGPWHLYQVGADIPVGDRGVLDLGDDVINLDNGIVIPNNHLASPDVQIDDENQRIVMYFHSGSSTYVNGEKVKDQLTYVSYSPYGLDFYENIQPVFLGDSYFRVFKYKDDLYAFSNGGSIYKALDADDPWTPPTGFDFTTKLWEKSSFNPFQSDITDIDGISSSELRVRHTAIRLVGDELQVFYSRRGDLLENIQMSTIDLSAGDWKQWDATYPPYQILQSSPGWEGGDLTPAPSESASAPEDVNQLRDPYVFEDVDGSLYLFYAGRGEDAIGLAQLYEAHADVSATNPRQDAYVEDGGASDTNFGTTSVLKVTQGTGSDLLNKIYVEFDLSQIDEADRAFVRLYAESEIACSVTAYETSDDSWIEDEITWNNAPEIGVAIATTQIGAEKGYYEWDVSNYVKENVGGSVTIAFLDASASDNTVRFSSREGENSPELRIFNYSSEYKMPPAAPAPLSVSAVSPSGINLVWTDNSINEDGFIIERKTGDGDFMEVATMGVNITSYSETDLESSTNYTYRVSAFNDQGLSEYSNEASAKTFSTNFVSFSYNVLEDAFVRGGESANSNFGTESDLIVKTGNKENFFRKTLLKFDLSNENITVDNLRSAVIRLYANKAEDCTITASEVDDNWTETSVTWSSAPVSVNYISTAQISAKGTYYEWNITPYLKNQISEDGIVSVCLEELEGVGADVFFNSKEAAGNRPELVISVDESPLSTNDRLDNGCLISLYPNPVSTVLNVNAGDCTINRIVIYNLTGQIVLSEKVVSNPFRIDVGYLNEGIYLLKAIGDSEAYTFKLNVNSSEICLK
ncbi:CBM96 family carbohydrate-binding protein [Geofilum sp. OHC36d9]|uniref:CBM96 family carbohydrate-binding protein n=1 Tax=Geofilum sp. OHC36d9 TaxID=3458413 RepID=UPI004033B5FF